MYTIYAIWQEIFRDKIFMFFRDALVTMDFIVIWSLFSQNLLTKAILSNSQNFRPTKISAVWYPYMEEWLCLMINQSMSNVHVMICNVDMPIYIVDMLVASVDVLKSNILPQ